MLAVLVSCWLSGGVAVPLAAVAQSPADPTLRQLHRAWHVRDGLPQSTVSDIVQTRDGYLWLATNGGLVRFDGVRFTIYDVHNTPDLPTNLVRDLLEDRSGALWLATEQGLVRYQDGAFDVWTDEDGLPSGSINGLLEDETGRLWVGGDDGLAYFDGTRFHFSGVPPTAIGVNTLTKHGGELWVGARNGLYRFDGVAYHEVPFTYPNAGERRPVQRLLSAPDGTLWVGTDGGLLRLRGETKQLFPLDPQPNRTDWVKGLYRDQHGILWVGARAGLFFFDEAEDRLVPLEVPLHPQSGVLVMYEDREGSLWMGTENDGLHQLRTRTVQLLTTEDGLPMDNILATLETRDGHLWVGTNCGGLAEAHEAGVTFYNYEDGLPNHCVWSLAEDTTGRLWIGSWGYGLAVMDRERQRIRQYEIYGLHDRMVILALFVDRKGQLWIGAGPDGLKRLHHGVVTSYTTEDGLPHDNVRTIYEGHDGTLWLGTVAGLAHFDGHTFKAFAEPPDLAAAFVRGIHEDAAGTLWVGTYGKGLFRLVDGVTTQFTTEDGLHENVISQIFEDADGFLWMSGNLGISRLARADLNDYAAGRIGRLNPVYYGREAGLRNPETNGGFMPAGYQRRDGTLVFPTQEGVAIIDPRHPGANPLPPPVVIEQVRVDGQPWPLHAPPIQLAAHERTFTIDYTGLSFIEPGRVHFNYWLEGFDETWREVGNRRQVIYTNVSPGAFTFHVRASNNDGVWNLEGASLPITVAAPWWQAWWAYLLYLGLAVLLVAAVVGWRTQRLNDQKAQLEALVQARTHEVAQSNQRLEKMNAQLQASNDDLQRLSDEKSEFMSIAAHDLKSPLFSVTGFADILLREGDELDPKEQTNFIRYIQQSAGTMLHLVTNLLDAHKIEQGGLEPAWQPVHLSALLEAQVARHRVQASDKDITLHLDQPATPIRLRSDPHFIERIVQNLLSNAIKYSPLGTDVFVTLANLPAEVRLAVRDEGPGLSEEDQQHLYRRFTTLSARPTGKERATGLGLSIAHDLTTALGGRLLCDSTLGAGATFTVTLPKDSSFAYT